MTNGIHIFDYTDTLIDFISFDEGAIIDGKMTLNDEENTDTFDFTLENWRVNDIKQRNRVVVDDPNGKSKEYIIVSIEDDFEDTTLFTCNASYLEDLKTARPIIPSRLESATTKQALGYALTHVKDWQVAEETEYGGTRTTSWTAFTNPYDLILQFCTTYSMQVDFYVVLGTHSIEGRYVTLRKPKRVFKGAEIVKGDNLLGLKRIVDYSEVRTALLAVGPEAEQAAESTDGTTVEEQKERLVIEVYDDDAQRVFGIPQNYIWDVYEPESTDSNMTEKRLRTLANTELNKRKRAAVSYELSSLDFGKYIDNLQNQRIELNDIVRVKDEDFTPPLYVEASIYGYTFNAISKETTYSFGDVIEYEKENLEKKFSSQLDKMRKKLEDKIGPLKSKVDNQQSYIDTIPDALNAKISKTIYDEDQERIKKEILNNLDDKVNGLTIGGRNLLLDSNSKKAETDYLLGVYKISVEIPNGTEVSISFKGQLSSDKGYFVIRNYNTVDDKAIVLATLNGTNKGKDGVYRGTFTWNNENAQKNNTLFVYAAPNITSYNYSVLDWIKLEIGNKTTDWTPAPEDTNLQFSNIEEQLKAQNRQIEELNKKINSSQSTSTSENVTSDTDTTDKN